MFDMLQSSTSKKRPSVFTRIGKGKDCKLFVFNKLKDIAQPKHSVFARIKTIEKSSSSQLQQEESIAFSHLGVINEV